MVSRICEEQKIERSEYRLSRRDVRQYTGWGDTQLRVHSASLGRAGVSAGASRRTRPELRLRAAVRSTTGDRQAAVARSDRNRKAQDLQLRQKERGVWEPVRGLIAGQNGGSAAGARSEETPVSMRRERDLYENLEEITSGEQLENRIVVVPPTRSNGAHVLAAG